ncbi:MAG TPA: helix-turn-helix transcriptional regulator [Candidatus Dormibacteraeota bacterium]|nr:helix-turn-helix transcriptional regulator [Candidatus Dormibacteraeota bacterium]
MSQLLTEPSDCITGLHLALLWQTQGLKEKELAKRAKVSQYTLSRAKHNNQTLKPNQARRIAVVLGVRAEFLSKLIHKDCLREPFRHLYQVADEAA